jgi:transposase-like protein
LSVKRSEKIAEESSVRKQSKPTKLKLPVRLYNNYSDFTRETFIDRMLENPQERGLVAKVARDLNINYRTVLRWWNYYKETEKVAYKKSEQNSGPKSSFTIEYNKYIKELLDNDPPVTFRRYNK